MPFHLELIQEHSVAAILHSRDRVFEQAQPRSRIGSLSQTQKLIATIKFHNVMHQHDLSLMTRAIVSGNWYE